MRSICFHPKTPSNSTTPTHSNHSTPSDQSSSRVMSFSESNIDRCIEAAESFISKWNVQTSAYAKVTSLFYNDKSEALQYIHCVNHLHKSMHLLLSYNPVPFDKLRLANKLMQLAMQRLQKEFYQLLSINRAYLDPESVSATSRSSISHFSSLSDYDVGEDSTSPDNNDDDDVISELEQFSSVAMRDLRSVAECMISCGYTKECVNVYRVIRKSIIDEGVYRLNLEKLSSSHVNKMDWRVLDLKIKSWLESVKIAVRTLFYGERILCDNVFATSDSIRECCFAEISRDGAGIVFAFPELVASRTKKSPPDKIFRLLDMYAVLSELLPEIQSIFSFNSTSEISSQAFHSLVRLADSVGTMLSDFESTIQKDTSKSVKSSGVHPLTIQSMDYLSVLSDYTNVLSEIFTDWLPPTSDIPDPDESPPAAKPISSRIAWLVTVLLRKLESKAKHTKDAPLSNLFLANNLRRVIDTARDSNLREVLGEEWLMKEESKMKEIVKKYEESAWGEVFSCLPENAEMSPEEAKVIFKKFNLRFEEAYRKQNVLVVPERKLRDEIKGSIARRIVPIYRELYDSHRMCAPSVREMTTYVTFTPDDVDNYLENLFFMGRRASVDETTPSSPSSVTSSPQRHH